MIVHDLEALEHNAINLKRRKSYQQKQQVKMMSWRAKLRRPEQSTAAGKPQLPIGNPFITSISSRGGAENFNPHRYRRTRLSSCQRKPKTIW